VTARTGRAVRKGGRRGEAARRANGSAAAPRRTPARRSAVAPAQSWTVYVVRCADGTLYTGIATDLARRIGEHNGNGALAAKYTRSRRPVTLVYSEAAPTRAAAAKREHQIKRLSRAQKEGLAAGVATARLPAS